MAKTISANDLLADLLRTHQLQLNRLTASQRIEAIKVLQDMAKELAGRVVAILPDQPLHWNRYKSESQLRKLIVEGREAVANRFGTYADGFTKDMRELAEYETQWSVNAMGKAIAIPSAIIAPISEKQIQAIVNDSLIQGSVLKEWLELREQVFVREFSNVVNIGVVSGESNTKIARRILGYTDSEGIHHPGIAEGTKKGTEALVRTATNTIANQARQRTYEANSKYIKGYQHISTLDARTTLICSSRDSLVWDMDHQPVGHDKEFIQPPLHFSCRSCLSPVLTSFRDLGIPIDDIPPSTRASMDGQVSEKLDFEQWIDSKGEAFQREYLGKGRYELWKAGKITFRDLTDQFGRPLTLEELKKLE